METNSKQPNLSNEKNRYEQKKFADLINNLLDKLEVGEIDRKEAAYQIAETMFNPEIEKDNEMLDIAMEAGHLELPDHHISGDPEKKWQEFIILFKNWEKKYLKS